MKLANLSRAAEINELLQAYKAARKELTDEKPIRINGVEIPHCIAYRFIQVLNVEINLLEKEVDKL